jgi:hypothetical protein
MQPAFQSKSELYIVDYHCYGVLHVEVELFELENVCFELKNTSEVCNYGCYLSDRHV